MSISVQHLVKVYGRQNAVDDISFAGQPGEVLGFLGPNGAGKSTTMKIATGYLSATRGRVEVCGYDVAEAPLEVRRRVGYLPEHNALYLDMYVREYLTFAGQTHGLRGHALRQRIGTMVEQTGLGREQHKKIGALSKGYRQRVGLAQALLHDPPVLILDEPTTGLDPNQLAEIRHLIRQLGRQKTVIFSTHIMQEVQALCDRVVIINRGQLVADSPVADLQSAVQGLTPVLVDFDADVDVAPLRRLPDVRKVTRLGEGSYRLDTTGDPRRVRADIFRMAAAQQYVLIGLRQEERSLEGVFRALTDGAATDREAPATPPRLS